MTSTNLTAEQEREREELMQRAIYLRGLFIQRYAGIESALAHLLAVASYVAPYKAFGRLPYVHDRRLKRLEALLGVDGFLSPYAAELRTHIDTFKKTEKQRHMIAHAVMATKQSDNGRILSFRMYQVKGKNVYLGALDITIEELQETADFLNPAAGGFMRVVSAATEQVKTGLVVIEPEIDSSSL